MKYKLRITIDKPLKEVTQLFTNRALLPQWQPELQDSKQVENFPYPKFTHQIALGRRKMILTETITRHNLPDQYEVEYNLKGVDQTVYHRFRESETRTTIWDTTTVYKFKGIMKLISFFSKSNLKKQSEITMLNFKGFAESRK